MTFEIQFLCTTDGWVYLTDINADAFPADISTADFRDGVLTLTACVSRSLPQG